MADYSTERNESTNDTIHFPNSALALMLVVNIVGILGNVLLIVAHVKDPLKVLKSPSSHFVLNIASIDGLLSSGFLVCTVFTLTPMKTRWSWDISFQSTALYLLNGLIFSALCAFYLSLAFERFLSVAYPLWHRVRMTTKVCRYWAIGIWLLLVGFRLIDLALRRKKTLTIMQSQMTFIILLSVLLMLTLSVYVASYISINRQSMELQNRTNTSEVTIRAARIRLQNEKNFLITIAIVCFVLAATLLPFATWSFISLVKVTKRQKENDNKFVVPPYMHWSLLLVGLSSAANVFVYLWRLPKYRKTFKKLYCDC